MEIFFHRRDLVSVDDAAVVPATAEQSTPRFLFKADGAVKLR
jgi:hypothetical protein